MPNRLDGLNPVTRLLLIVGVTTPIFLSLDWVSGLSSVLLTCALAPICGMSWPQLFKAAWPLFWVASISGLSMLLYGNEGGQEYFSFWMASITDNSIQLAGAVMIRVFAVTLPVIVLARGMDPTRLGDALAQVLHLPSRFVIGAVAGVRMVSLFRDDWDSLARARRARGIADMGRAKYLATMSFGLLVLALRRGGKLATAMEARGFGRTPPGIVRTWAEPSQLHAKDYWALAFGAVIAAIPVLLSLYLGAWRLFGL